ncbi:MAG: hypothetical protein H0X67_24220 [Acidobacteria bacterium]|nr:hypothetical protein [Acidobacteriota bacterium]
MYTALAALTFGAPIVTGAIGFGLSSIFVPLALLFLSNPRLLEEILV